MDFSCEDVLKSCGYAYETGGEPIPKGGSFGTAVTLEF